MGPLVTGRSDFGKWLATHHRVDGIKDLQANGDSAAGVYFCGIDGKSGEFPGRSGSSGRSGRGLP
jgi:hypothetical protein